MNPILSNLPDVWSNGNVELIVDKTDTALWRLVDDERSAVLKQFKNTDTHIEILAYKLLRQLGVPTLRVYDNGANWILIEDLLISPTWRLATEEEMSREQTGIAVAEWYRLLHAAGRKLFTPAMEVPPFLQREYDTLTPESIAETALRLGMADLPVWKIAVDYIADLKNAFQSYPETLNYNDFHWTNLALSRDAPLRAVVFDYHLLGIGPACCDIRNVCGSLGPPAKDAFIARYGKTDDSIAILDRPLSILYSLQVASMLPKLPGWAEGLLFQVKNNELEPQILAALSTL